MFSDIDDTDNSLEKDYDYDNNLGNHENSNEILNFECLNHSIPAI